jgi:hypothetical protein
MKRLTSLIFIASMVIPAAVFAQQPTPPNKTLPKPDAYRPQIGKIDPDGGGGGSLYIDNQIAAAQSSANFWIDGVGIAYRLVAGSLYSDNGLGHAGCFYVPDANGWSISFNGGGDIARFNNTGIGIGTVPAAQLHTTGTVRFAGLANNNSLTRVIVSDGSGNLAWRDASTLGGGGGSSQWTTNGTSIYYNTGNVGIGVTAPAEKLNIGSGGNIQLESGNVYLRTNGRDRYYNLANSAFSEIYNPSTDATAQMAFMVGGTERIRINAVGGVGIATTNIPSTYKLAVGGNIIAEKVRVKLQSSGWPDYVFDHEYGLPSLAELEEFVKLYKHLPGVPSAQHVEKNGLDLGDGQAILLKKIEELTLYVIELNKKIDTLKTENEKLKQE